MEIVIGRSCTTRKIGESKNVGTTGIYQAKMGICLQLLNMETRFN
ncbi:hypothetical protein Cflav_PD3874 [Pedosphaera parvula Ellin514]|uniref:Uncharacterized protein n=1 Tax=Pedosphaera parvula (strain Ellin514) TaxID=320771 RepID=B9XFZ5_PEDPL|nr:hypothetical protein Cflav_PD3874 [Pedosphaera parvula Ellin514]